MYIRQILGAIIDTGPLPKANADSHTLSTVLNLVFGTVASIAVLIIVVSGFRYIVAHGDPSATAQARNGVIYAVVGLLITMAAYSIVIFVVKGLV
jgi:hypothetical protein